MGQPGPPAVKWAIALIALAACAPKPSSDNVKPDVAAPVVTTTSTPDASSESRLVVRPAESDTDAISTIRVARLQAKAEGRVLVVYLSATWCQPCKQLKAEIEAGNLDARLSRTTLLMFDADKDGERLVAAGYQIKFVPFVALPGPDGHPVDTQQATGGGKDAWKELLGKLDAWNAAGPR